MYSIILSLIAVCATVLAMPAIALAKLAEPGKKEGTFQEEDSMVTSSFLLPYPMLYDVPLGSNILIPKQDWINQDSRTTVGFCTKTKYTKTKNGRCKKNSDGDLIGFSAFE